MDESDNFTPQNRAESMSGQRVCAVQISTGSGSGTHLCGKMPNHDAEHQCYECNHWWGTELTDRMNEVFTKKLRYEQGRAVKFEAALRCIATWGWHPRRSVAIEALGDKPHPSWHYRNSLEWFREKAKYGQ